MKPVQAQRHTRPSGEVRIIGGQWRRSKLQVPNRPGLRPTPDRVRETLFNWLGQDLTGWRCLDAFAGSGALGFEAASRGAQMVHLFERDPGLASALRAHAQRLGADAVSVQGADALAGMKQSAAASWDVVFLDPPFGDAASGHNEGLFQQALEAAARLIRSDGYIYLEAPRPWLHADVAPLGLALWRQGRAGQVYYHLLVHPLTGSADNPTP